MRGLSGDPKKVPPAETFFSAPSNTCTWSHSLNVTGSVDRFSSTVSPSVAATLRTFTLFKSFTAARERKPTRIARVMGSMFGNSRAFPPYVMCNRSTSVGASCARNLPSFSPRFRYGRTSS